MSDDYLAVPRPGLYGYEHAWHVLKNWDGGRWCGTTVTGTNYYAGHVVVGYGGGAGGNSYVYHAGGNVSVTAGGGAGGTSGGVGGSSASALGNALRGGGTVYRPAAQVAWNVNYIVQHYGRGGSST